MLPPVKDGQGLRTAHLDYFGKKLLKGVSNNIIFKGANSAETLCHLRSTKRPCCFILNTETADKKTGHWVALYLSSLGGPIFFFDSFGRDIDHKVFQDCWGDAVRLLSGGQKIISNRKAVQKRNSNLCGSHCLYYLTQRVKHPLRYPNHQITGKMNDQYIYKWSVANGILPKGYNYLIPYV